jgi:hypothetical protein
MMFNIPMSATDTSHYPPEDWARNFFPCRYKPKPKFRNGYRPPKTGKHCKQKR